MNIDADALREIVYGDHPDFEDVSDTVLSHKTRWSIYKSRVVKQLSTGKLFRAYWGEGATEYQEGQPEEWSFTEVVPKQVMVTIYGDLPGGQKFEGYTN